MFNLHFTKISTEIDNNFGYKKITQLVDNIPLSEKVRNIVTNFCEKGYWFGIGKSIKSVCVRGEGG